MSVVPYNLQNKLVYHDPYTEVAILHDPQNHTVRLLDTPRRWAARGKPDFDPASATCPQCGFDLRGFFDAPRSRRRASFSEPLFPEDFRDEAPDFRGRVESRISKSSFAPALEYLGTLGGTYFMHRDYFKLLAGLNHDLRLAYAGDGGSGHRRFGKLEASVGSLPPPDPGLPSDLFNQGYFDRFFQKVPPFVLGSGAHAHVYKVQHVLKNIPLGLFAVKRINVGDHSKYLEHVLNEVLILYELSANGATANNLIRYNHVWMEMGDLHDSGTFIVPPESSTIQASARIPYVYILQQYCAGGNLETIISEHYPRKEHMSVRDRVEMERRRRKSKASEQPSASPPWLLDIETWKFFRDIANGVHYLHENKILHRDLKPSNCLLETAYSVSHAPGLFADASALDEYLATLPRVLVSDFGEGKFIDKSKIPEVRMGNTGTVEFADPKLWVYDSVKNYTHPFTYSCDIYSLGLILCYLCVGSSPFAEQILGLDDPELVRGVISTWYANLQKSAFFKWWRAQSVAVRGGYTNCTHDLGILAYAMLKGDADSKTVLLQMDAIKTYFLQPKANVRPQKAELWRPYRHIKLLAVYIVNLVVLELLDGQQPSYHWKVLKAVSVVGLVYNSGLTPLLCLFILTMGVGVAQTVAWSSRKD